MSASGGCPYPKPTHLTMLKSVAYILKKLDEGWGKLRRFYLVHYREDHVRRHLTLRRGECRRCGSCCRLMFRCPHLGGENQCNIYTCRYKQCIAFPIDDRDLKYLRHTCGHHFVSPRTVTPPGNEAALTQSTNILRPSPLPALERSEGMGEERVGVNPPPPSPSHQGRGTRPNGRTTRHPK